FITAATITQLNQEFIAAVTTTQLNQESTTTTTTQPTQELYFSKKMLSLVFSYYVLYLTTLEILI
ncbi:11915_t:CDS:1, partial [Entrophospora sp. SA101]